jgi:hypothetical protein
MQHKHYHQQMVTRNKWDKLAEGFIKDIKNITGTSKLTIGNKILQNIV